jgi:DNA-damage-inducible protein D
LEYSEFRHFLPVIERAKEACSKSGHLVSDHFEDYLEEIVHGKCARQTYESVKFSRYACYLKAHNGDKRKPEIRPYAKPENDNFNVFYRVLK